MEMTSVLVTGDRGYIGAVLVPMLLKNNYKVIGLDTEYFTKTIGKEIPYRKIKKDIRNITKKDLRGIDVVVHLAALSNDPIGEVNPKLTREINLTASLRLARLSKQAGVKRFLFASSCSIYGIVSGTVDETTPANPQTVYATSKVKVEKTLQKLADDTFQVGLLRNSTVYGYSPKFRNDLVVNNFVTCAFALGKIKVMSDGTPWRPLIDVRDLSRIFIAFIKAEDKKFNGEIVNIGFEENNFQVKDIITLVKKHIPECEVEFTGEHGVDTRSYRVNFKKFKKMFPKFKKQWPLDRSIADLIKQLRKINYSKNDFLGGKFTRIVVLKKLLENKIIDKNLYFV
jgi:nucleoside-diphosphate-sugar epimerase